MAEFGSQKCAQAPRRQNTERHMIRYMMLCGFPLKKLHVTVGHARISRSRRCGVQFLFGDRGVAAAKAFPAAGGDKNPPGGQEKRGRCRGGKLNAGEGSKQKNPPKESADGCFVDRLHGAPRRRAPSRPSRRVIEAKKSEAARFEGRHWIGGL